MCRNQFAIYWNLILALFFFYKYAYAKKSIYNTSLNYTHKYFGMFLMLLNKI